jgi:hypothetical protein
MCTGFLMCRSCFGSGCRPPAGNTPLPSECYSCKYATDGENCVLQCPDGMTPNKNKRCSSEYLSFSIKNIYFITSIDVCSVLPETYDLTFKAATSEYSNATIPSTTSTFSICVWIKFPVYKQEYFKKEYGLLSYLSSISIDMTFTNLAVGYEKEGIPILVLKYFYW